MQRTISIRLLTGLEQYLALKQTLELSRVCFNAVSEFGWQNKTTNGVALHHGTYNVFRQTHPELPAQLVISARMKATESLRAMSTLRRKGKHVSCPVQTRGTIRYDQRSYSIKDDVVSLASITGRIKAKFCLNKHAERWMQKSIGYASADLIERPSGLWLMIVLKIPDVTVAPTGKVVGVDLGINRPAVTSERQFLGEKRWKETEKRYFRLKRSLQAKGTKSAKQHLRRLSGRQGRFRKNCDHVLSKHIVQNLESGTIVAIENLTGIRDNTKQRGSKQRRKHHGWSYAQLRSFTTYKAEERGCQVVAVDPRQTSQRCSSCGHIHKRNRLTQSLFRCRECGYELNADLNASCNIKWKYLAENGTSVLCGLVVNQPIVGEQSTYKPPPEGGGS
jgi:IS605 OrfB family transposase